MLMLILNRIHGHDCHGDKLALPVCRRSMDEPITDGDQFRKALKQLHQFPMLTLFLIFEILLLIYHVYANQPSEGMKISLAVSFALWPEYVFGCKSYNPHLCGSDIWQET